MDIKVAANGGHAGYYPSVALSNRQMMNMSLIEYNSKGTRVEECL